MHGVCKVCAFMVRCDGPKRRFVSLLRWVNGLVCADKVDLTRRREAVEGVAVPDLVKHSTWSGRPQNPRKYIVHIIDLTVIAHLSEGKQRSIVPSRGGGTSLNDQVEGGIVSSRVKLARRVIFSQGEMACCRR